MIKDKQWLKEALLELRSKENPANYQTERTRELGRVQQWAWNNCVDRAYELVEQLDEPEVLSQVENINIALDGLKEYIKEQQSISQNVGLAHTPAGNDTHYRQYDYVLECIDEYELSDDLKDLLVPEQEESEADKQINKLANFIMSEVEGEPSQSEGAVDTAIRIIKSYQNQETLSQEWINKYSYAVAYDGMPDDTEIVYVDDLQNLLVPKQEEVHEYAQGWVDGIAEYVKDLESGENLIVVEKPVIPEFVAEWIEEAKPHNSLRVAFEYIAQRKSGNHDDELAFWMEEGNSETFARAWLDGYTVEEEQKYYARIKGWELFADFVGAKYWGAVSSYGRLGIGSVDDAISMTKDEWNELGINDKNADFVPVEENE